MMKFCSSISLESLVLVEGTIQPVEKEVEATTIKKYEVHISKVMYFTSLSLRYKHIPQLWTVVAVNPLPIQISAASAPAAPENASVSSLGITVLEKGVIQE